MNIPIITIGYLEFENRRFTTLDKVMNYYYDLERKNTLIITEKHDAS